MDAEKSGLIQEFLHKKGNDIERLLGCGSTKNCGIFKVLEQRLEGLAGAQIEASNEEDEEERADILEQPAADERTRLMQKLIRPVTFCSQVA